MILPAVAFRFERQMLAPLAKSLPSLLGIPGGHIVRTLREVPLDLIIPDLLIGHWVPKHAPGAFPTTTGVDSFVRALLERDGPLAAHEIEERLFLSGSAAASSITRLMRSGAVTPAAESAEGASRAPRWALASTARAGALEIIAVEAKLTRWQIAVRQAAEYLEFADRALVVLDGNRVSESESLLEAVRAAGVGLMMQHRQVLRPVVAPPVHPTPLTPARVLALTKLTTVRGGRAFRVRAPEPPSPLHVPFA